MLYIDAEESSFCQHVIMNSYKIYIINPLCLLLLTPKFICCVCKITFENKFQTIVVKVAKNRVGGDLIVIQHTFSILKVIYCITFIFTSVL